MSSIEGILAGLVYLLVFAVFFIIGFFVNSLPAEILGI